MPITIKKHWDVVFALGIGFIVFLIGIIGMSGTVPWTSCVSAATETVEIQATVASWVSLQVSPTSTTIAPDLVTAAGGVNIGESDYIQITGGTNNANGYSLDIKSLNAALCHSEGCATGTISSATATLVAGVDGYGSQATSSDGDVSIDAAYDYSTSTNDVGGMETTDQDLADTTGPSSDDITWLTFKAAATSTKPSGAYLDIITLTLIGGS